MGEPYLHKLTLEFVPEKGPASDKQTIAFGIVQTDSELTPEGYRLFKVNGKPVLVRGGGWAPDMMLRVNESRREAEFRYVKEMGLNTIRLEGKLEDESFWNAPIATAFWSWLDGAAATHGKSGTNGATKIATFQSIPSAIKSFACARIPASLSG